MLLKYQKKEKKSHGRLDILYTLTKLALYEI